MTAALSVLMAAASLSIVLVVGPRWVVGADRSAGLSETLPRDVVVGSAFVMVTAGTLVALQLFEWLSLIIVSVGLAALWRARRARRHEGAPAMEVLSDQARAVLYLLEAASEAGNQPVKQAVRRWWHEALRPRLQLASKVRPIGRDLAWWVSAVAVLAGGFVARSLYALGHVALVPAENYEQLTAMGQLRQGRMFPFGAEPVGARVVLASAAELTPASYEDVVRFGGPLLATASVALICMLVLRATNRRGAALAAAVLAAADPVVGLSSAGGPVVAPTAAGALGLLVALGGVAIAMEFARSRSWRPVRQVALAALAVVLVHPASLVVMAPAVLASGAIVAVHQRRAAPLAQLVFAAGVGAFAGWLPVLLAQATGVTAAQAGEGAMPGHPALVTLVVMSLAGAVLALALAGRGLRSGRVEPAPAFVLAGTAVAWLVIPHADLPIAFLRHQELPGVLLAAGVGLGVAYLRRSALVFVSVAALASLAVTGFQTRLPNLEDGVTEDEAAARALAGHLAGVTDMSYTVIGSGPSLSRVVGRTWRADLEAFTRLLSLEQAADPGFVLPVPSDDLLLVAQTSPPAPTSGPRAAARRAAAAAEGAIARQADEWMTVYARYHPGASIVFEDHGVRIWSVRHTGDRALAERFKLAFR